ncbi:uncharacterized protein PRCAT00003911001 [Priceomyces carsonii]|uniref:uncharacterized protein n=1 Tax=Priceomyces carsonii TaxID=28549 RepID=UPI002ED7B253|nr:unnamed protein product [Priceomyces carsonii]
MSQAKADVEMKNDEVPGTEVETESETEKLVNEIVQSFTLLNKASANYDNRYISKLFRDLGPLRRRLSGDALYKVFNRVYREALPERSYLVESVQTVSKVEEDEAMEVDSSVTLNGNSVLPEIDLYIHLLVQIYLLDNKKLSDLATFNKKVISLVKSYNKRTLDFIQAKLWFYVARTSELTNDLQSLRPALYDALRTATLRHDTETTASIITLLLRNYLLTHDVNQASNLVEKVEFPENAGNALVARHYYYLARISAIQLDYSTAHEYVIAAIRKAPQTHLANGFIQSATKLSIIIELLMGDIPELNTFKTQAGNFEPYLSLTKAVRQGDLKLFVDTLSKYEPYFKKDDNYTLVLRLRQNVIKTGIRIISLAYSKISLKDICIKLHLDSEESTEYIVSKSIRDGVIEANLNHERGFMKSKELLDIYSTKLPQNELDQRIRFCLALYNDSVKSMRYPSEDNNKEDLNQKSLESKEDEIDLLKAIEDGDLDDFMD